MIKTDESAIAEQMGWSPRKMLVDGQEFVVQLRPIWVDAQADWCQGTGFGEDYFKYSEEPDPSMAECYASLKGCVSVFFYGEQSVVNICVRKGTDHIESAFPTIIEMAKTGKNGQVGGRWLGYVEWDDGLRKSIRYGAIACLKYDEYDFVQAVMRKRTELGLSAGTAFTTGEHEESERVCPSGGRAFELPVSMEQRWPAPAPAVESPVYGGGCAEIEPQPAAARLMDVGGHGPKQVEIDALASRERPENAAVMSGHFKITSWGKTVEYDGKPYVFTAPKQWEFLRKLFDAHGEFVDCGKGLKRFFSRPKGANDFYEAAISPRGTGRSGDGTYRLNI